MGVADGLLRVMPGWEISAWGHTLALDNLVPLLAGIGCFLALGAYPFVESWATGDDREQHVLDRPLLRDETGRSGTSAARPRQGSPRTAGTARTAGPPEPSGC
ncbi:hypothetical protein [Streptomyces shenzhenensis]|uniref:hypothetical protein n=1 Tax=Streptomyces shenzhenensis TaxID=943815 RepID=UPI0033D22AF8